MSSRNNVILTGRLTKDPQLQQTQGGQSVCTFNMAVDRSFKNKQTGKYDADFPMLTAWGKTAENIQRFFHKGDALSVEGELRTRSYDDKNGRRVFLTEVWVNSFDFLPKNNVQPEQSQPVPPAVQPTAPAAQPAPQQAQQEDPFTNSGQAVDISDDDLPF